MTDLGSWLSDVAQHAYGWPESLRFTYDKTRELLKQGVPGDLVECGVGAGVHPAVMARGCQDAGETRIIRLFDSFAGIPHGGEHDRDWNASWGDGSGRLESSGVTVHSEADVIANLMRWVPRYEWEIYKGWFQETVPHAAEEIGSIAFLRLDGDLYESTKVCLEHLYPLVSPGGVVVVDDFNLDGCRQALLEYEHAPSVVTHITQSGDVWWRKP